jgi:Family of unknown function (DUF6951)
MEKQKGGKKEDAVRLEVDPGICAFTCLIYAFKDEKYTVRFGIQSDCDQIQNLARNLGKISMKDLFLPLSRNPIFLSAEKSKCHLACPIPCSIVKAAEVAMGLALPKRVTITFENS